MPASIGVWSRASTWICASSFLLKLGHILSAIVQDKPACGTIKKFRETNKLSKQFKSTAHHRVPPTNFRFKRELWYTSQDDYLDQSMAIAAWLEQ